MLQCWNIVAFDVPKSTTLMLLFFKKSGCVILAKYCCHVILNNLSVFEFVIHDHVSHYLQFKINSCQHSFM